MNVQDSSATLHQLQYLTALTYTCLPIPYQCSHQQIEELDFLTFASKATGILTFDTAYNALITNYHFYTD